MTDDDFLSLAYEMSDEWSDLIPDGTRHTMSGDDGLLSCCGRNPLSIPAGDAMTPDPQRVTCTGRGAS